MVHCLLIGSHKASTSQAHWRIGEVACESLSLRRLLGPEAAASTMVP
jgi:hypothetical protein